MDIYIKRKRRFEINCVEELEIFIKKNNIKKHFIRFNDKVRKNIEEKIKSTKRINLKQLKKEFISEYFTCYTSFKIQYWIDRGYDEKNAVAKIKEVQLINVNKFHKKRKNNPNKYFGWINTNIDYWMKRDYSENDAILKIKERQSTFSKEKLIKKYGKEMGNKILKDRNRKWLTTLKKNNDWGELSYRKGNAGLNKIKTLKQYTDYYGELIGSQKYAKRYWGLIIKTEDEFYEYQEFLAREYTIKFYDKNFRKIILEEQTFKCGECKILNKDAIFNLHHIDYDKKNDNRENLIFLCRYCHSKTTNLNKNNKIVEYYKIKNRSFYEN